VSADKGPAKTRVVILGGGHGGTRAARQLLKQRTPSDNMEITLVSHENAEVWHGLMPQVVAGLIQPQYALVPLRQILPGVTLYTYEITAIDLPNRRVLLDQGDEREQLVLEYDYLVLALGSVTDLSRFPGLAEHGLQTKTIGDVFHLRNHLIEVLERAAVEQDPLERQRLLTVVVAGAGFAGVEIGAQANQLLREALRFYPTIRASELRLYVLGRTPRLLPSLSPRLAALAARQMRRSGIQLLLKVGLTSATATAALLSDGRQIPTRTVILTVGVGTHPLIVPLPVRQERGRVACDAYCRVPGWPGVYAVGDNAAVPRGDGGAPYPTTAFVAFTQGARAAENILAERRGQPPAPYRFRGGDAALLSKGYGLFQFGPLMLDGVVAAVLWRLIFVAYMPTWQRRIALCLDWFTSSLFPRDIAQMTIERSDAMIPMRFAPGEVIIREGEPGSRFYIISEGEVEVVRRGSGDQEEYVESLGPGHYFGEIALLHDTMRTATVRAVVETRVLSMAREQFSTLVSSMPLLRETFEHPGNRALARRSAPPQES
jgi:NADH dehydrogenase